MKPGSGKIKGSQFERDTCRKLSLWISSNKVDNLLWRSAASGGRATLQRKKGIENKDQAADISSISEAGFKLTNTFVVECKFYKDLGLGSFFLGKSSKLKTFFDEVKNIADGLGKLPFLVAKQNYIDTLLISTPEIWNNIVQVNSNEMTETTVSGQGYGNIMKVFLLEEFLSKCILADPKTYWNDLKGPNE